MRIREQAVRPVLGRRRQSAGRFTCGDHFFLYIRRRIAMAVICCQLTVASATEPSDTPQGRRSPGGRRSTICADGVGVT